MSEEIDLINKSVGCLLLGAIADALGAPVEGWSIAGIKEKYGLVNEYYDGTHMGIRGEGNRKGMYTDDTNAVLGLASSLVEKKGFDPEHIAKQYSKFFFTGIKRGAPNSAQKVLKSIKNGMDFRYTGRIVFSDGSYANGGGMRIAPIGVFCRNVRNPKIFREYVRLAIISSHVHPEAIDGAFVIARFVQHAVNCKNPDDFDFKKTLVEVIDECETSEMKRYLTELRKHLFRDSEEQEEQEGEEGDIEKEVDEEEDQKFLKGLLSSYRFQIRATDAITVVLLGVYRYHKDPILCVSKVIGFGGDSDTTGAMTGNIMGGLYGRTAIPKALVGGLENEERGRDYIIHIGKKLASIEPSDLSVFPRLKDEAKYVDLHKLERWDQTYTLLQSMQNKMPSLSRSRERISGLDEETKKKLDEINSLEDTEKEKIHTEEFEDLKLKQQGKYFQDFNKKLQTKIVLHYGCVSTLTTNVFVIECSQKMEPLTEDVKDLYHMVGGKKFYDDHFEKISGTTLVEGEIVPLYLTEGKAILFARTPTALYPDENNEKIRKYDKNKLSEEKKRRLEKMYWDVLLFGKRKGMRTIAVPALSTDRVMFGFHENFRVEVAVIAVRTVRKFLAQYGTYETVVLVMQSVENQTIFEKLLQLYFPS